MADSRDFRAYFSDDSTEAYVLREPLPRLGLKNEPEPEDAPLYIDLDTGEGFYPEDVSGQEAFDAATYAKEQADSDANIHLREDNDAWRNEFSGLFGKNETARFWSVNLDDHDPRN